MAEKGRYFDNFIEGYLQHTKHMEAPQQFHLWTAISIIAGALQGKCYISQTFFKWKPNCFIIFVAPPGVVAKSSTSGVGTRLLRKVPGVNFGPQSGTWQAFWGHFAEIEQKYRVGGEEVSMSNMTLEASELGTLITFKDDEIIDTFVDLWDGKDQPLTRKTVGGGEVTIHNPCINLIACTTPSFLQRNLDSYAIEGGFTSRAIFVYADTKEKAVAYPGDHVPDNHSFMSKRLVEDLTAISSLSGEFTLTEKAKKFGIEWYEDFTLNKPAKLADPRLGGYCARKQTHLHKIAMCISAACSGDKIITEEHMRLAMGLLDSTELNLLKVFENISDDKSAARMSILKKGLLALKATDVSKKVFFRNVSTQMGWEDYEKAIQGLQMAGYCKLKQKASELYLCPNHKLLKENN